jgi:hypothetical protein
MEEQTTRKELLSPEELQERSIGQDLFEMTKTNGFNRLRDKLNELAFHSWVDPRETTNKAEWEWRELNGFHAANNAKEIMEWIQQSINRAEYLEKKRRGEVGARPLTIK